MHGLPARMPIQWTLLLCLRCKVAAAAGCPCNAIQGTVIKLQLDQWTNLQDEEEEEKLEWKRSGVTPDDKLRDVVWRGGIHSLSPPQVMMKY